MNNKKQIPIKNSYQIVRNFVVIPEEGHDFSLIINRPITYIWRCHDKYSPAVIYGGYDQIAGLSTGAGLGGRIGLVNHKRR